MLPLITLLVVFLISLLIIRVRSRKWNFEQSGTIAMSVMLIFTAIGHFLYTEGMASMLPAFIPFKILMVYFSGILEILGAVGLLILRFRKLTSVLLILFFILVLPANINAALEGVNYQDNTYDGPGTDYLWFRIPLQILFILWVYFFCLRPFLNAPARGNTYSVR